MLGLTIFGLFSLSRLEVDELPDLTFPRVFVAVPYPGASPGQVEREIVDRMEDAFSALTGVDEITSKSLDGFGQILVQFDFSKSPDQASQDVRDAISSIAAALGLALMLMLTLLVIPTIYETLHGLRERLGRLFRRKQAKGPKQPPGPRAGSDSVEEEQLAEAGARR